MKNIHKLFALLLLSTVTALVISCGNASTEAIEEEHHDEAENTAELTDKQIKTAGIELGKVEQKQISGTIKVNGMLDVPPQQMVSVSAPLGGFLKSTVLLQGSRVTKGQVIAVIENPEYIQLQQDYLEAKNQFDFAYADYERQQELAKENVNAQKTLQQAKTTYQSWLAKKNGLLAKLKLINVDMTSLEAGTISSTSNIYSTINGFVTEVNVNIGKFVNPSDILFEIVDTEHLHAELIIFEKDVRKIKIGQKVRFTLANETKERMATVYLIGREISADRTIRIHCHIDKEDKDLLPGMYLKAIVETGGTAVTALPNEAIIDFQGKKYVFIKTEEGHGDDEENQTKEGSEEGGEHKEEGQHFMMQEIVVGNSELGYTEVILPEGWNNENEVVVKGAYAILSKMKNSEEEGHGH
ncbi:MAG: efflux RND transporter periplasmic adaptor subunit [Cyclobacteriaceae bacterium]|jgi:membrane fusion protein, heavy metal efflux system|nr:efflux RND transporter periplasmic adaptor subunit [Cyclobacteriaceae bacterium]MCK6617130.1 efflux RND transporter periplasmic adaptor subunit [Cyclobacteriaceae bacterium]